jgi:hypothetical protein
MVRCKRAGWGQLANRRLATGRTNTRILASQPVGQLASWPRKALSPCA